MLGIGLDFGTTNSTLAIFDGRSVTYIEIDEEAIGEGIVMPTANYMDRSYTARIGTQALNMYLERNQGRRVVLKETALGHIRVTHGETSTFRGREDAGGDTTVPISIHARVDQNMPGLLFRGLKRWLGMSSIEHIDVFGTKYKIVALITPILSHIAKRLYSSIPGKLNAIHIGRPVQFESDTVDGNTIAVRRLNKACRYAGLPDPIFFPEPLGATLSFLSKEAVEPGSAILAFDFGGGTLDLCILKTEKDGYTLPITHGLPIGGDHINQMVYRSKIFPELGKGLLITASEYGREYRHLFPFKKYETGLLAWHQTYTLNREEYLDSIDTALYMNRRDREAMEKLSRLRELITWNYSYSVIKAIEEAKIQLSENHIAWIEVAELDLCVKMTKTEFERIIATILTQADQAIDHILDQAGIPPESISKVVATGGSSLIPAVRKMLENRFQGRISASSTFKSIAAGLAIASYHGYCSGQPAKVPGEIDAV